MEVGDIVIRTRGGVRIGDIPIGTLCVITEITKSTTFVRLFEGSGEVLVDLDEYDIIKLTSVPLENSLAEELFQKQIKIEIGLE